ncbi:MAG: phytanoyl-CoA dioxygenase family protein [Bradyrhizobium sp.]|nr:phytanoyl-CoA dioxygenase family protein [Bradyrhizobium sp.]
MGIAFQTPRADVALMEPPVLQAQGPLDDVFFGAPASEQAFCGEAGLLKGPSFNADELLKIRELIKGHLVETAHGQSPRAAAAIAGVELDQYHLISSEIDHAKLLSKQGRILPKRVVDAIKEMSFFDYLRKTMGPYCLSDEEGVGQEQVCFRIVRPERREDVGSLHRDAWFWDHYGFHRPEGVGRGKVWVAVSGDPDRAGLLLAPGSHHKPAPYRTDTVNGKLGFVPDFDIHEIGLQRYCGDLGEPIMFNYNTLHVGSLNRSGRCRVSFEVTVMFKAFS